MGEALEEVVELPSGNFWETARVDQGMHVLRPGVEHLDAWKVPGPEPACLGRMRAVKGERAMYRRHQGACSLEVLAPPPNKPGRVV